MIYDFSKALNENIERTYTYAFAKNKGLYQGTADNYNPIEFFCTQLELENPFKVFMELDRHAFTNAKRALIRYEIPYTNEEERKARVYEDVTKKMIEERSDYVSIFIDDYANTGVVLYKSPCTLTTEKTLYVRDCIDRLPLDAPAYNMIYEQLVPPELKASREQYTALKTCLSNQVSCLIGGAGTGKSFVTAAIIQQLIKNGNKVAVLAPTHKAREALQDKLDERRIASTVKTIHSFVHNPFECDAIVIDESGMLSTPLFASLMDVHSHQQLIFVGDKNQLEPIDYGRPFERIQSKFKVSELKDNKRSESGDIVALGREILGIPQNANMPINNIEVVGTIEEAFKKGAEVALSFTNNDVKAINEKERIKHGPRTVSPGFSVGDVIVAKANQKGRFYNGQLFTITSFNTAQKSGGGRTVIFDSPKDLEYNFDLAYGLTIHKSQGSEWNVVAYKPSVLDYQNLAYVAVTRAKKKLIIVGDGIQKDYLPNREWRHIG